MAFLFVHSWFFFFISEGLTWVATLAFFVTRYRYKWERPSQWCLTCIVLCTIFQALLVCINYYFTGTVSFFQVVIVLFILYAVTLGSADFQRLDTYIKKRFFIDNRYYVPSPPKPKKLRVLETDDRHFFRRRHRLFAIHAAIFISFHVVWFITLASHQPILLNEWLFYPHLGLFSLQELNIISYIWTIIFFFDFLINAFYKAQRHL